MTDTTIDTTAYRFRTAVGGFHKGDVAEYIAKTAQQHRTESQNKDKIINQLQQENMELRQQLNALLSEAESPDEVSEEVTEVSVESPALTELELEAYRRAEAAERLANQRAKKLYIQMESICSGTSAKFETAKIAVEETAQTVLNQAKVLDEACRKLTDALNVSRQELIAMDAMLPDPAEALEETV